MIAGVEVCYGKSWNATDDECTCQKTQIRTQRKKNVLSDHVRKVDGALHSEAHISKSLARNGQKTTGCSERQQPAKTKKTGKIQKQSK